MKKILVYLLIISFVSCTKHKVQEKEAIQAKQKNKTNEYLREKDSISGNEYIYYFKKEKSNDSKNVYCKLDSLVVLKNGEKYILDLLNKDIAPADFELTNIVYANDDYNFDGVNDIMLYPYVENYSVYGNDYRAYFFLYSKKNNRFEENNQLESLPNVDICKKNKYVFSRKLFKRIPLERRLFKTNENNY